MLNEIIKGISMTLSSTFGFEIFANRVEQGLQAPCFFISVLKPEASPLLGRRSMRRYALDIQYFPTETRKNDEMYQVADRLMESLEFIRLPEGDLLHGTQISYEVVDGVLHFFVTYNLSMYRPTESTYMETLETEVNTQNEKNTMKGKVK